MECDLLGEDRRLIAELTSLASSELRCVDLYQGQSRYRFSSSADGLYSQEGGEQSLIVRTFLYGCFRSGRVIG